MFSGAQWPWVDEGSPSIYLLSYWQQLFQLWQALRQWKCFYIPDKSPHGEELSEGR